MFNKIIKYIIALLLLIMIFCNIPNEFNPIANIFIFVLLGLLFLYFFDTCSNSVLEYFNIRDTSNNNIRDTSNNYVYSENEPDPSIFHRRPRNKDPLTMDSLELELELKKRLVERINELDNNNEIIEKIEKNKPTDLFTKDLSNANCKNNDKLILLNNIHDNIQKLLLSYLENIIYDEETIKFKQHINDIILSIKSKNEPNIIYNKVENLTNLLKDSNSELYDLFKNILLILSSIIHQKPIVLNNIKSEINNDIAIEIYIKKHFLPLFEKLLLVTLSYNKLPIHLQASIKEIINLINNDSNINNILKKSKEINNNILIETNDKQIVSDKIANTYLLMSTRTLDLIIKKIELLILQESFEIKFDIIKLNKDLKIIMKTHLGKILKLNISLENNLSNSSNIKTYVLVDFDPSDIEVIDESETQISDMLKQLANKLDTNNNECNCENRVKEAVDKYLKNGKYVDDNGIIKNIIDSDMIYNQLDISMLQSLGSHDNTFSNKWDKGYTYLDTNKWNVPKVQLSNPPNINNIVSSLTPGYPINLLEFDNSRKVLGPDKINLQYIKEKLN
jgi:hypothetical protein